MTGDVEDFEPSDDQVVIYQSKSFLRSEKWRWRRIAGNGEELAKSSEGYTSSKHCLAMAVRCNKDVRVVWEGRHGL